MGGVMPVPAVCGGAIETLITSIVKKYSKEDGFHLTIFSVYHKEAVEAAKKYPDVRFVWTHTNTFWNLAKHAVFLTIRGLIGKTIRVLQRHYNEIAPVIQNEKFDLLIVEGGDEQAVLDIAKGYRRDQLVFHAHVHFIPKEEVVKGYGHMIGVSEFVTKEYLKACKIPVRAHVLKNAIDVERFSKNVSEEQKRSLRKKLGLSEKDFVILFVGRIMQIKGVLELMQAVTSLEDKHIKLLIMGNANSGKWAYSSYERRVKKLSEQNKDRIVFTGYVDNSEVYQYAAVADVQCLPTLIAEAAPLVVLEAMAEGLPMIVTKSGGVIEYVDDSTALMIEQENIVDNLKNAICYMKEHLEVRKQMSKNAKIQSKRYNEAIYYKNFIDLINKIMFENMENKNEN
ncbi:MAG: glycosyltransferase family 4 protein [bacterium]|nr:glycosyltransferase family 4 protein [bacterium]MDY5456863.1 glycosyltransferase family 4 protein [Bariatricus sp.]